MNLSTISDNNPVYYFLKRWQEFIQPNSVVDSEPPITIDYVQQTIESILDLSLTPFFNYLGITLINTYAIEVVCDLLTIEYKPPRGGLKIVSFLLNEKINNTPIIFDHVNLSSEEKRKLIHDLREQNISIIEIQRKTGIHMSVIFKILSDE